MDIILDEKSIEMIHLKYQFSNSMMGSREGRIDSYSKKKKDTSIGQMVKYRCGWRKKTRGLMERGI